MILIIHEGRLCRVWQLRKSPSKETGLLTLLLGPEMRKPVSTWKTNKDARFLLAEIIMWTDETGLDPSLQLTSKAELTNAATGRWGERLCARRRGNASAWWKPLMFLNRDSNSHLGNPSVCMCVGAELRSHSRVSPRPYWSATHESMGCMHAHTECVYSKHACVFFLIDDQACVTFPHERSFRKSDLSRSCWSTFVCLPVQFWRGDIVRVSPLCCKLWQVEVFSVQSLEEQVEANGKRLWNTRKYCFVSPPGGT